MRNFCKSKMASSASTRWTWDDEKTESSCKRDTKSRSQSRYETRAGASFPMETPPKAIIQVKVKGNLSFLPQGV